MREVWRFMQGGALAAAVLLPSAVSGEVALNEDTTASPVTIVPMEQLPQSLDATAPESQFTPQDGEEIWREARRAALAKHQHGGGIFDFQLVPDEFRSAANFYNERFAPGTVSDRLSMVITAAQATRKGSVLELSEMRLVYFIVDAPPPAEKKPGEPATAKTKPGPATSTAVNANQSAKINANPAAKKEAGKKEESKKKKEGGSSDGFSMPGGGSMVIYAPFAEINLETNAGYAHGNARIEIFPKAEPGKEARCLTRLTSPQIHWRSWNDAESGSVRAQMYTCEEDEAKEDPEVYGEFITPQADGPDSTMKIWGRGLVFESGKFERPMPVYDEDSRTAGLSMIERSKAIFHSHISTEISASTIQSLMPFQGALPEKKAAVPGAHKKPPPDPERSLVTCNGPAIFDMAYVPRQNFGVVVDPNANAETLDLELTVKPLGKRFEFLNEVKLVKRSINEKAGAPDLATHMVCKHMRIQYRPGTMPSASNPPDYTEAIGGVEMYGYKVTPPEEGQAPPPPEPFRIECNRLYYDGANDGMFLVGEKNPAYVAESAMTAFAQQFCFHRTTQTLTMPSQGPKKMIKHATPAVPKPGAPAAAAAGTQMLDSGDTVLAWNGPLYRELQHLPVRHQKDLIKEVLTLNTDVIIEQRESGLKIYGDRVRLHQDLLTNRFEFLDAYGDVELSMGDLKARGETVTVEMAYDDNGALNKNLVTVVGSHKLGLKADVFKGGGTAVRAERFLIDRIANNFDAYGGTVAVVKSEKPPAPPDSEPKPAAAKGAGGLVSGVTFDSGGDIFIQCDGDFVQRGATNTVVCDGHVLIRQPGLTLLSDHVVISLDDPPPAAGADPAQPAKADATPAADFFSGNMKAIQCLGMVEMVTDDKLIHCDTMEFDKKANTCHMQMDDPEDDVRIYMHDDKGDKVLCSRKDLQLDQNTGKFEPGGQLRIRSYKRLTPAPRGRENSPARIADQ